jgi:hypothetical protein
MEHFKEFKVNLPKNWMDISDENPNGPPTFIRKEWNKNPGMFQISFAQHPFNSESNPEHKDLIKLSKEFDSEDEFELMSTNSGKCLYGLYGYAEFKNEEFPFVSVWHLSNKINIVFLTYISTEKQEKCDINEVYDIFKNIRS